MQESRTSSLSPWVWSAAIWFGIALFDATDTVANMHAMGMHHDWTHLFFMVFVPWLPWAVASPLVLRLGRRYPITFSRSITARSWGIGVHLGACLSIGLVQGAISTALHKAWNPYLENPAPGPFLDLWVANLFGGLLGYLILYTFILMIGHVIDSRARLAQQQVETAKLNAQLSKAQLDALRRQIEPHFLFNTLNSVAGLVRERRNDDAVTMVAALSDFLRRTLEESNGQLTSLGEEMKFLREYLAIQKLRFAERLQVKVEIPEELLAAQVPSLVLQPVVENAVKHGISKLVRGGEIRVAAARSNGTLRLSVCNDGPQFESGHNGVGLSNLRMRLAGLYGENFELTTRNQDRGGVEVALSVPFSEA